MSAREPLSRRGLVLGAPLAGAAVPLLSPLLTATPADAARPPRPGATTEVDLPDAVRATGLDPFCVVGATWSPDSRPAVVEVSVRRDDEWSPWLRLPGGSHGDASEGTRVGTDPLWVGRADGVRTRVRGGGPDTRLVLLDPGETPTDLLVAARSAQPDDELGLLARADGGGVPQPALLSRRRWGADESWRSSDPRYNKVLKQVHVHHSASGNDYSRGEVPAIIRGFYRYHTQSLGWSDLGYNFLVDRFGRAWVGRAGGAARRVRGAHTLGFNKQSTGVCIIGNHQQRGPSREALRAVARIAAWKLDLAGIDPQQRVRVRSTGSDRYAAGRRVWLPAIDGHRDTNQTACPGDEVYRRLRQIRRRAAAIVERHDS
jgi:hypothetical protein